MSCGHPEVVLKQQSSSDSDGNGQWVVVVGVLRSIPTNKIGRCFTEGASLKALHQVHGI